MNTLLFKKLSFLIAILFIVSVGCKKSEKSKDDDYAALVKLKIEIDEMANSVSCTNSSDWNYTPIGSKACGGPSGYIAYSKNINVEVFMVKVQNYASMEKAFNQQWGIVSDCSLPQQPKNVECVDGKAKLVY